MTPVNDDNVIVRLTAGTQYQSAPTTANSTLLVYVLIVTWPHWKRTSTTTIATLILDGRSHRYSEYATTIAEWRIAVEYWWTTNHRYDLIIDGRLHRYSEYATTTAEWRITFEYWWTTSHRYYNRVTQALGHARFKRAPNFKKNIRKPCRLEQIKSRHANPDWIYSGRE